TLLEIEDLAVGAHPVGRWRQTLDPLDKHTPVPAPVEQREVPLARDMTPEAPQVRLRALLLRRRGDRDDFVPSGVEAARDAEDGPAFACRVVSLENKHDPDVVEALVSR